MTQIQDRAVVAASPAAGTRARSETLAGARGRLHSPAYGRARRHDREYRDAVGPAGAGHLRREPAVDRDGVHARLRWPVAARRPDRRLRRPQAGLPHRPHRLRGRLGARGHRRQRGHAVRGAGTPRCVRRAARPGRALADHGDVHRHQGPGQGVRRVRRDLRRRCRDRADHGRPAHRVHELAVDPAGQHPDRADRVRAGRADRPGEPGQRQHAVRRTRRGPGDRWPGGPGVRVHEGGRGRLVGRQHADLLRDRHRDAGRLRGGRGALGEPAAAAARGVGPQPRRFVPGLGAAWRGPAGDVPVHDVLLPGHAALLAAAQRHRLPAVLGCAHRHRDRRAVDCCRGSARAT